ncbi:hypothetical protein COLO4_18103 [Corchorus olitorius]|uniref:Uncharacterized protein n=1 Tax=Corchorus olitorius TaxID=93759 RepID=A0A1R3JAF7_9ROSI|nr:hypothetical protein COLO4_18103 [Corchorus olitorius]
MPKVFLQTSLRPILVNLAYTKNLSIPLLQCLARLLELFTNYFDVTLGGKLLEHLKKWLELDKLAQSQKSWKAGEEPKFAAEFMPNAAMEVMIINVLIRVSLSLDLCSQVVANTLDTLMLLMVFVLRGFIVAKSRLKPLTKHLREKMQIVASELLELWREIVIKATAKNKKAEPLVPSSLRKLRILVLQIGGETVKVEKNSKDERRASIVKKPSESPAAPPKLLSLVKCDDPLRANFRRLEEPWHQSLLLIHIKSIRPLPPELGSNLSLMIPLLDHNELQAR